MSTRGNQTRSNRAEYGRELRQYLWDGLAIVLTLRPFGLVK
ncbi:MAG: hypothetical protein ACREV7_00125 [Steroidobacteraceae bacterium]